MIMKAYCWKTGRIEFGRKVPDGALLIAEAPSRMLRPVVSVCARHGYEEGVLLVPGVPEASLMKYDPVEKLIQFCDMVQQRLNKRQGRAA